MERLSDCVTVSLLCPVQVDADPSVLADRIHRAVLPTVDALQVRLEEDPPPRADPGYDFYQALGMGFVIAYPWSGPALTRADILAEVSVGRTVYGVNTGMWVEAARAMARYTADFGRMGGYAAIAYGHGDQSHAGPMHFAEADVIGDLCRRLSPVIAEFRLE